MFGFSKSSIGLELVEPLIFLRKPPSWSAYAHDEEGKCQLRGIITIDSSSIIKLKSKDCHIRIRLIGKSRSITWKKGIAKEEELILHDQSINLPFPSKQFDNHSFTSSSSSSTVSIPFSLSVPADLPPTVDTEFGRIDYTVSAARLGNDKNNIGQTKEDKTVRLVYDAAIPFGQNVRGNNELTNGHIRTVQDDWNETFHWNWTSMTDCATAGGYVPIQLSLVRIGNLKENFACLKSFEISLTEETSIVTNSNPDVVRRRWTLLKFQEKGENGLKNLLPMNETYSSKDDLINASKKGRCSNYKDIKNSSDNMNNETENALQHLIDPNGPWTLSWDVQLPVCAKTRCHSTIKHPRSPIQVSHILRISLIFQDDKIEGNLFEVECSIPFTIRSIYLTDPYSQLPCYWCSCFLPHPYEAREERSEGGILAYHESQPQSMDISSDSSPPINSTENQKGGILSSNRFKSSSSTTNNSTITINEHQRAAELWIQLTAKDDHVLPPPYA